MDLIDSFNPIHKWKYLNSLIRPCYLILPTHSIGNSCKLTCGSILIYSYMPIDKFILPNEMKRSNNLWEKPSASHRGCVKI